MLSVATCNAGSSTLFSFATVNACFASLIAKETPNPGRESRGGAYAPVVKLGVCQYLVYL